MKGEYIEIMSFYDQPRRVRLGANLDICYFDRHGSHLALLYSNQGRKTKRLHVGRLRKKCTTPNAYAQGILTLQKGPDLWQT